MGVSGDTAKWTSARIDELRAAVAGDDAQSFVEPASLYRDGVRSVRGNTILARNSRLERKYLERAVRLGHPIAMCSLADALWTPRAREKDVRRAIRLFQRSFSRGTAVAAFNLACTYRNRGKYREAVRWFRAAAPRVSKGRSSKLHSRRCTASELAGTQLPDSPSYDGSLAALVNTAPHRVAMTCCIASAGT